MKWRLGLAISISALLATACHADHDERAGPSEADGLRVASAAFPESQLLAEMYAQVIESTGTPVVRLGPVGPREIIAPALESGLIDLMPEYLGTALEYFGAAAADPNTESARADLNRRLGARNLTALRPSPAQDKNVFVVTIDTAERYELVELSDLLGVADEMRFGGLPECPDRPLCLAGLDEVYGIDFAEFVSQRSLDFTAEALRRDEIDIGLMFSTAAQLDDPTFVVLEDDRGLQPAENLVPIARSAALARWGPDFVQAMDLMSIRLTTADLRRLNARVAIGESLADVARDWLRQKHVAEASDG